MMVANFVKNYLEEYNNAQVKESLISEARPNHWTPLRHGRYKVNFDGAFEKSSSRGGIGVIIQNSEGVVTRAHVGHKLGMIDAFMVEAFAAISTLEFAQQMGLHEIEVEGDALGIIKLLQSHEDDLSIISNLIEEAKIISKYFHSCIFMHTGREMNMIADSLTKYGLDVQDEIFWAEDYPQFLSEQIANDVSCLY